MPQVDTIVRLYDCWLLAGALRTSVTREIGPVLNHIDPHNMASISIPTDSPWAQAATGKVNHCHYRLRWTEIPLLCRTRSSPCLCRDPRADCWRMKLKPPRESAMSDSPQSGHRLRLARRASRAWQVRRRSPSLADQLCRNEKWGEGNNSPIPRLVICIAAVYIAKIAKSYCRQSAS